MEVNSMSKFLDLKILLVALILLVLCRQSFAQENRQITFVFEGNKVFLSAELLSVLEKCRSDLQRNGAEDSDRTIDDCLRKPVRTYMFDKGYFTAKIGDLKKEQTEKGLQVIVPVSEGKQYYIGELEIEGEKIFTDKEILKSFPLKKGDIANASLIHQWISSLETFYANRGFVQFSCEPEPTFTNNTVNLKFWIDEGKSFKIGRIEFVTDANLRNNFLKRYLTFEEGEIFNKQKLKESIEKLNSLNEFQRIDVDRDVRLLSDNEIPVINLKINIKKKQQ